MRVLLLENFDKSLVFKEINEIFWDGDLSDFGNTFDPSKDKKIEGVVLRNILNENFYVTPVNKETYNQLLKDGITRGWLDLSFTPYLIEAEYQEILEELNMRRR